MEKELLERFCCADKDKGNICRPWSTSAYTYATDGHIMVRVPRMSDIDANDTAPDVEHNPYSEMFNREPAEWVGVPEVDYEATTCPHCNGTVKGIVCPECEGYGVVSLESDFNTYDEQDCKTCKGKAQLSVAQFEEFKARHRYKNPGVVETCDECWGTGKVWTLEGKVVNGVKINLKFLSLLGKLPNAKLGTFEPMTVARFIFDGGEGLLMPMKPDSN